MRDIAAQADEEEGIRQGLEDVENGKVRLKREFFAELRSPKWQARSGLSRFVATHI